MSIFLLIAIPFLLTSAALSFALKTTPRVDLKRPKHDESAHLDLRAGADQDQTATRA